jgi:hypothetical protein
MMQRADNQPITIGITIYGGIYCKMYEIIDNGTIIPSCASLRPYHAGDAGRGAGVVR